MVGGIPTPLKNMNVSWNDETLSICKNKQCSTPPTRYVYIYIYTHRVEEQTYPHRNGSILNDIKPDRMNRPNKFYTCLYIIPVRFNP